MAPLVAVGAFPAGHERQRSKPLAPWCFPAAHGVHSAAAALVWFCGPNLPGVQLLPVQDAEPAAPLYCPDGHGVQPSEPLLLCAPAGHEVLHAAAAASTCPRSPNLPAGHPEPEHGVEEQKVYLLRLRQSVIGLGLPLRCLPEGHFEHPPLL